VTIAAIGILFVRTSHISENSLATQPRMCIYPKIVREAWGHAYSLGSLGLDL
jgi:hypothetical protein